MKINLQKLVMSVAACILTVALVSPVAFAQTCNPSTTQGAIQCGTDQAGGSTQGPGQADKNVNNTVTDIINILSAVVGVAAVIMLIISGLNYITSNGDSEKIKSAKNSLVYAIIGLVIVALAQTIAHFALTEATTPGILLL